jgi:serine/threonine protein kinase
MGLDNHNNQVYIIDFGLARRYRDPKTHLHIPYKEKCHPTGTTSFASINNHLGVERLRCDDMESLAYVLVYFLRGSLPWFGSKPAVDTQWRDATLQWKMSSSLDLLGSACPNEFSVFLSYTRTLRFDKKPDYTYLRKIFHELLVCEEYQYEHMFAQWSDIPDT